MEIELDDMFACTADTLVPPVFRLQIKNKVNIYRKHIKIVIFTISEKQVIVKFNTLCGFFQVMNGISSTQYVIFPEIQLFKEIN